MSPLQLASLKGHAGVVAQLLQAGADVAMSDVDGDTALHWAAQGGSAQVRPAEDMQLTTSTCLISLGRCVISSSVAAQGAPVNCASAGGAHTEHCSCQHICACGIVSPAHRLVH